MIWIICVLILCIVVHPSETSLRIERAISDDESPIQNIVGGGAPGKDFPVFSKVPRSDFICRGRIAGYYADEEFGCQVFHICHSDGRKDSFLCPNGTIFNQEKLVCDWWYNVDCSLSELHLNVNEGFGKSRNDFTGNEISSGRGHEEKATKNKNHFGGSRSSAFRDKFGQTNLENSINQQTLEEQVLEDEVNQFGGNDDDDDISHTFFRTGSINPQTRSSIVFNNNNNNRHISSNRFLDGFSKTDSTKRKGGNSFSDIRGIPFPPTLTQIHFDADLKDRSGRTSHTTTDPPITTISPQNEHFVLPSSFITPPKEDLARIFNDKTGKFSKVKKVMVNKRPVSSFSTVIRHNPKIQSIAKETSKPISQGKPIGNQSSKIIDDSSVSNQFFNLGSPVKSSNRVGQPLAHENRRSNLPSNITVSIRPLSRTSTQTTTTASRVVQDTRTHSNHFNDPFLQSNKQRDNKQVIKTSDFGKLAMKPKVSSQRAGIHKSDHFSSKVLPNPVNRPQLNLHPVTVGNKNEKTGIDITTSKQNQSPITNRGSATFFTSKLGGRASVTTRKGKPGITVSKPAVVTTVKPKVKITKHTIDSFGNGHFDNNRLNTKKLGNDFNKKRTNIDLFSVDHQFDHDHFDLDDKFDDDRFDLDDKFDDDRFDLDDKFDDDRFDLDDKSDDDRFDFSDKLEKDSFDLDAKKDDRLHLNDKLSDDRFDDLDDKIDDRFDLDDNRDDDRFDIDDKFDDDRFDLDDKFDDDRFDFTGKHVEFKFNVNSDNDGLEKKLNKAHFGRITRGSSASTNKQQPSEDEHFTKLGIKPPPEIQLPPPPR